MAWMLPILSFNCGSVSCGEYFECAYDVLYCLTRVYETDILSQNPGNAPAI
ncbi:hypothetical protein SAMN05216345_11815 [Cupriavidus sp. YR651]|nr:hypothetical protein SAMN05216345_11815 [Cupriavidus sp. YR651]